MKFEFKYEEFREPEAGEQINSYFREMAHHYKQEIKRFFEYILQELNEANNG
jgi:hypothetical protein